MMAIVALIGAGTLIPVPVSSLPAQALAATARSLGGPLKVVGQPAAVGDEVVVVWGDNGGCRDQDGKHSAEPRPARGPTEPSRAGHVR